MNMHLAYSFMRFLRQDESVPAPMVKIALGIIAAGDCLTTTETRAYGVDSEKSLKDS